MGSMTMNRISLAIGGLIISVSISCDKPACHQSIEALHGLDLRSNVYQEILSEELGKYKFSDLRYWVANYEEEGSNGYIIVDITGDSLCAQVRILVEDWSKMEGLKQAKGISYLGAELKGLTFEKRETDHGSLFVLNQLDRIID